MTKAKLNIQWICGRFQSKGLHGDSSTLVGNRIYCFGANNSNDFGAIFQIDSHTWTPLPAPEVSLDRYYHTAVLVEDKIYFHGGEIASTHLDDLVEYDTVLSTFRQIYPHKGNLKRSAGSAIFAPWRREIIFYAGIEYGGAPMRRNDATFLNVDTMTWSDTTTKGELPPPRSAHDASLDLYNMYIFGGYGGGNLYLNDLWVADLSTRFTMTWSKVVSTGLTPVGRSVLCLNKLGPMLVLFGGYGGYGNVREELELFVLKDKNWTKAPGEIAKLEGNLPFSHGYASENVNDSILYFTAKGVYKLSLDF